MITFTELDTPEIQFRVTNKRDYVLGVIKWQSMFQRYVFVEQFATMSVDDKIHVEEFLNRLETAGTRAEIVILLFNKVGRKSFMQGKCIVLLSHKKKLNSKAFLREREVRGLHDTLNTRRKQD